MTGRDTGAQGSGRDRTDRDARLTEEIQFHIDQQTAKHVREGMSPDRARREALLKFGGVEATKTSTRDQMPLAWFRDFGRDLRYGVRGLKRAPSFAATAMLTLGLGIGVSTALFSVVDGVLFRALPYPEADRIVRLYQVSNDDDGTVRRSANVSEPNAVDWRQRTRGFEALAMMGRRSTVPVVGGGEPMMAGRATVSREFFDVLGVAPATGRRFSPAELSEGGPPAALVSHALSLRMFGGPPSPDATLRIGQTTYDVVGAMPAGFDYPGGTDVWTPTEWYPVQTERTAHNFQVVARLARGTSLEAAQADLSAVSRGMKAEHGDDIWLSDATAVPLLEQTTATTRPALQMLFAAAIVLFVIACMNVSNLLLARDASRAQEVALQLAIGAARWRIVRQRLAETLVLCLSGASIGLVVAVLTIRGLVALDPGSVPRLQDVTVNWVTMAFALAAALTATLAISLITALRRSDRNLRAVLGDAQRSGTGADRARAREALVVSQVALTLVLLAGTALLGRSFMQLQAVDPGYRTADAVVLDLVVPGSTAPNALERRAQLQQEFMDTVRSLPGVESVGLTSGLPAGGSRYYPDGRYIEMMSVNEIQSFDDVAALGDQLEQRAGNSGFRVVGGDYFSTMEIPLRAGRVFEAGDVADAPHVAVVSQSFADERWPDRDPLGRFIQFGNMDGDLRGFRVVGVVGNVRELSPETPPGPLFYVDYRQRPGQASSVSVVVLGGGPDLPASAQRLLRAIDPDVPVQVRQLDEVFDEALSGRRFNLLLIAAFGIAALGLAVLGTYGLTSYLVTQRRQEIGIRLALGANASTVVRLVAGRAARLALIGTAIGLGAAMLLKGLVEGFLFSVSATDPATLAGVVAVTAGAVIAASLLPAWRATRISPTETLRG